MKAAAVGTLLQVLLLMLPLMDGTFQLRDGDNERNLSSEECDVDHDTGSKTLRRYTARSSAVKTFFCFGIPPVCIDMNSLMMTIPSKRRADLGSKQRRVAPRAKKQSCYENIEVKMTPNCPAFQPVDFSELKINDFCIGSKVEFDGTIHFLVGLTDPAYVDINVTRIEEDEIGDGRRSEELNNYSFTKDVCELFPQIVCPSNLRIGCTCPISAGRVFFYTSVLVEEDFLPESLGYGLFNARLDFETPEGIYCLNLSFNRIRR